MERRLAKLHTERYIEWPDRGQLKSKPIPESICWLGWKGILILAGQSGVMVDAPKGENENQMRIFQSKLRSHGIRWAREPRWSLLEHNLTVVDFRIAIERSVRELPELVLENWLPDSYFRIDPDVVTYKAYDREKNLKQMKKRICPDAFFEIVDLERRDRGESHKARFLLELDMSTHDNGNFGREKVAPGAAYIKSPGYKSRFGSNSGIWLVVTSGGERRLRNLIRQGQAQAGSDAHLFFFTCTNSIENENILTSSIWWQPGEDEPRAILSS